MASDKSPVTTMKRHFVHVLQDKMLLLESALAKVVITRVQTGIAELQECQQKKHSRSSLRLIHQPKLHGRRGDG